MNQASTSLIKIGLLIIGLYLTQSCANDSCETKINDQLSGNEFFAQAKAFTLSGQDNEWLTSNKSSQEVIESRYAYKVEVNLESELILLNHTQVKKNDITAVLEQEFIKLVERFKDDDLDKVPNVGFQVIYPSKPDNSSEKLSETICTINQSILELKAKDTNVDEERTSKLLQPRFSFFPN